jgi:hypothetical protein
LVVVLITLARLARWGNLPAARLQHPAGNAKNVTARASFLLEEYPTRDREKTDGGTQGPNPPIL